MFKRLLAVLLMFITCLVVVINVSFTPENLKENANFLSNAKNSVVTSARKLWSGITNGLKIKFPKVDLNIGTENTESSLESYTVEYVIDGDTFIVSMDGYSTKIRLIGVDTPESVASDAYLQSSGKENTTEGKEASNFTTDLITGKTVYLEYDTDKIDKYGRTFAYVYLDENKETMLQDVLLEKGLACTMTIKPNTRYAAHFAEIETQAKENGAGFWGAGFWS